MDRITFSLADTSDLQEVMLVYRSLWDPNGANCGWSEAYPSLEQVQNDISNKALYVLRDGRRIVAVATMSALSELAPLKWTAANPCEMERLGVIPAMQKRGLAQKMLQELIGLAKREGFGGMVLLVAKPNTAAFALYEKCGFERCGETFMWDKDFFCYQQVF